MSLIPKKINEEVRKIAAKRCKERGVIIPTFAQLKNPQEKVPQQIKDKLKTVGLWDVNPLNLFRITWKNDIKTGLYGNVNYIELPETLTGVEAKIIGLTGKFFPTGAHKVGAAFGCLVPRLVTGEFNPETQKAVWPSTGNYCRGGAFDCALLGCDAIAILPEEMSKERFEWLKTIGTKEIYATPGCESNVKEIYDKCWELKRTRGDEVVIFNQFSEFGNALWHYEITGSAIEEVFKSLLVTQANLKLVGYVSATGSAGTIAAGDYLKKKFSGLKILAAEALQCPTLYLNGYGGHRIEGIGDKHVPWIHNVRNTDSVAAIDDEITIRLMRLFNEPIGRELLMKEGVPKGIVDKLDLLGISGICNLVAAIKFAKYFELTKKDVVVTIFTDSMELYQSRIEEYKKLRGNYTTEQGYRDIELLHSISIDWIKELSYYDRKALHNLKYFTWVEQQGKTVEELNTLWSETFWDEIFSSVEEIDRLIIEFNELVQKM
ncbi:MAG: pyridoxal-phosphate dependent enzyme [Endomicrobia bacterium]|nr:pyridoxal-phosphate dependent enzyme [Endomicrobiia bacterium]MCX7940843.1 pyridoxal-phosphate dependent enzyme [Endomicrobiia bacterium]MDW8055525.1 pyridoxal-phosphate dependent enzyme [Elusimicrobiota bacterium]